VPKRKLTNNKDQTGDNTGQDIEYNEKELIVLDGEFHPVVII